MKITTVAEKEFDTKLDVPTTVFLSGGLTNGIPLADFIESLETIIGAARKVERVLDFDGILVVCMVKGNVGFVTGTREKETGL